MANSGINPESFILGMSAISAAVALLPGVGVGLSQGIACGKACEAVSRQPEARGSITSTLLLGDALAETSVIFGLVISLLLLFANPLIANYTSLGIGK